MKATAWVFAISGLTITRAAAQQVQVIRLEVNPSRDQYQFIPASVTARVGDVLVFKVVNGSPHSIVFQGEGLSPAARDALNGALPRRAADLSSPLLTAAGQEYRVTVPALPGGTYRFFCLPHRAYDMRGELRIR